MKKKTFASKLVCLLVTLAMLFSLVPATTFAADPATISLETSAETVKPGDQFTVYVNITPNSSLAAIDYSLYYNADEFEIVGSRKGDAFKAWEDAAEEAFAKVQPVYAANTDIAGEVNISATSTFTMQAGGCFSEVVFKAKADAILADADFVQLIKTAKTLSGNEGELDRVESDLVSEPAIGEEDNQYSDIVTVDPDIASIKAVPTTTAYTTGDAFDPSGTLTVTYTNDQTQDFSFTDEGVEISTPDMSTAGTKTVTVSYRGVETTFNITVSDRSIVKSNFVAPATLTYKEDKPNQTLDLSGAGWNVEWSDGKTEFIDATKVDVTVEGYNFSEDGEQDVTVKCAEYGLEGKFTITVEPKVLENVTVTGEAEKKVYVLGEDTSIDPSGLSYVFHYDVGEDETQAVPANACNANLSKIGKTNVEVMYNGKAIYTYEIEVVNAVKSFTVTKPTKVDYVAGQPLDLAGGALNLVYMDDSTGSIPMTSNRVVLTTADGTVLKDKDTLSEGTYPITVSVDNGRRTVEDAFTLNVVAKQIIDAQFTAPTNPQDYKEGVEGQTLDLTGAKWTATYNDGDVQEFGVTEAMCDSSSYDFNTPGTYNVVVSLEGWNKTETFQITVKPKVATGIKTNNPPTKTEYVASPNTAFDPSGATITVAYDNGRSEDIDVTADMCSDVDLTTVGTKTVTVTYTDPTTGKVFTTDFRVVAKRQLVAINWTEEPQALNYFQGAEYFEVVDGIFKAVYSDTTVVENIGLTEEMCSGYDLNTPGIQTVTVTYSVPGDNETVASSATEDFEIKVSGITLESQPVKLNYELGEAFDGTGITATFYDYSNAEVVTKTVDWASGQLSIEGYDANNEAVQSITLVYVDENGVAYRLANAFEVTVGHPDAQPGDGSQDGATGVNGQAGTNNPITGTAAGGITMIVALIVVAAILFRVYRLRVKR